MDQLAEEDQLLSLVGQLLFEDLLLLPAAHRPPVREEDGNDDGDNGKDEGPVHDG